MPGRITRHDSRRSENFPFLEPETAIGRDRGVSIAGNADWLGTPSLSYTGLVAHATSSVLIIATTHDMTRTQTIYKNVRAIYQLVR